jgi:hypothetical protein
MPRFFHRIRKSFFLLVPANDTGQKLSRYLLYAIGEIILVVIGILIALQINNWNAQKKDQALNQKYLKLLQSDLELDLAHFLALKLDLSQQAHDIDSIKMLLSSPKMTLSQLNGIIKESYLLFKLVEDTSLNRSTFNALQNSGRFDLLENDLQNGLRVLNQEQNTYVEYTKDNIDAFMQTSAVFIEQIPILFDTVDSSMALNRSIADHLWNTVDWPVVQRGYINLLTLRSLYVSSAIQRIDKISASTEQQLQLLKSKGT